MSVSLKSKNQYISLFLTRIRFSFIFVSSNERLTNRSVLFYTDVVFIILSLTIFGKPCYGYMIFFFNLLGCFHLLVVKCWYCVDDLKQKTVKDKQKQVVTG